MNHFNNFSIKLNSILEKDDIKIDELMKYHTSFKVGGPADILVTPTSFEQVNEILKLCKENGVPYFIIGNGSNLIVKDGGIRGVVIKLVKLNKVVIDGNVVTAQCGATLKEVSDAALEKSLTGFEFASGIPGSVGGATTMNAGAYEGDVSKIIDSVLILDNEGNIRRLSREELEFGYRMSAILKYGYTVLETVFKLNDGEYNKIKDRIDELTIKRETRQPLEYPSAGSVFKRPEGHFTGKLVEDSGLKGFSIGGAQVSEKHAGFIINRDNAKAKDILELIAHVQKTIKSNFGVDLHTEVRIVGED